ncbi:CCN family member 5-like isoform X2 [Engystomops pustulosus]|uniref:CCN family member 5-like isoform X2 n=1 Tax=Engystomops pustulosus TaxID=76066 RepID=UPI003AFAB671
MEMGSYIAGGLMLLCVTCTLGETPGCPMTCECSAVPACPPESAAALDSCGCGCVVCVQGLGLPCDGLRPCDLSQNLMCDYEGDPSGQHGVCKVILVSQEPQSCFHDGNEILHGQEFEIDCESYCKCENGNIKCAPLCPEPERPLNPTCEEMQLVTAPGECCPQWRCLEESSGLEDWAEPQNIDTTLDEVSIEDKAKIRSRREAPDSEQDEEPLEESHSCNPDTEWTPCSRTCGIGNSVRIIYNRETCIPKAEKRLCMIRPCKGQYPSANYTVLKASNVCSHLMRWTHPLHLRFRDCLSSRPLLLKFCGHCSDGRYCTPLRSETRPVQFQCSQFKKKVTRKVMWVQRCQCGGKRQKKGKKVESAIKPKAEITNEVVDDGDNQNHGGSLD